MLKVNAGLVSISKYELTTECDKNRHGNHNSNKGV